MTYYLKYAILNDEEERNKMTQLISLKDRLNYINGFLLEHLAAVLPDHERYALEKHRDLDNAKFEKETQLNIQVLGNHCVLPMSIILRPEMATVPMTLEESRSLLDLQGSFTSSLVNNEITKDKIKQFLLLLENALFKISGGEYVKYDRVLLPTEESPTPYSDSVKAVDILKQISIATAANESKQKSELEKKKKKEYKKLVPSELVKGLDEYVIGQDRVKKSIAVHVSTHFNHVKDDPDMKKTMPLIIGESGSGKTYIWQVLGKLMDRDVKIVDSAAISKSGYVGRSINQIMQDLFAETNYDVDKFHNLIIVFDEIDKKIGTDSSIDQGAQNELLKIVEGTHMYLESERRGSGATVDTSLICMGFTGAFFGLVKKIREKKRLEEGGGIGFSSAIMSEEDAKNLARKHPITHQDLIDYGMLPELVGRIGLIVHTDPITEVDWKRILTEPKGCVREHYNKLLAHINSEDEVTDEDIENIIKLSKDLGIGARGLKAVADDYFIDRLYY